MVLPWGKGVRGVVACKVLAREVGLPEPGMPEMAIRMRWEAGVRWYFSWRKLVERFGEGGETVLHLPQILMTSLLTCSSMIQISCCVRAADLICIIMMVVSTTGCLRGTTRPRPQSDRR